MLSKTILKQLQEQVQKEATASNHYLELATWCETRYLDGFASHFYASSDEERSHMLEFYKYINLNGGEATLETIKAGKLKFKHLLDVLEYVYTLGHEVTLSINALAKSCFEEQDFATYQFLQAFILEQQQAEQTALDHIHLVKTLGYQTEKEMYYANKAFKKVIAQASTSEEKSL